MPSPRFHNLYNDDKKSDNKTINEETATEKTAVVYSMSDKAKSWFSVIFVALEIITFIPGVIILNSTDGRGWFLSLHIIRRLLFL